MGIVNLTGRSLGYSSAVVNTKLINLIIRVGGGRGHQRSMLGHDVSELVASQRFHSEGDNPVLYRRAASSGNWMRIARSQDYRQQWQHAIEPLFLHLGQSWKKSSS